MIDLVCFLSLLQVVEMYSSGGDLHLELPTGQQGGTIKLWVSPPFDFKAMDLLCLFTLNMAGVSNNEVIVCC